MAKLESAFQKELMDEIRERYPGCVIIKNDPNYIQGFPDWTILYKDKWVVIEAKRSASAKHQPNQDFYIKKLNDMSYATFAYPENKEVVLREIQSALKP